MKTAYHRHETLYFLNIGAMVLATAPTVISTVLGSCVSITMYDPARRIGAICHAALAECPSGAKCRRSRCPTSGKFVKCAVRVMTKELKRQGTFKTDIEVKLFGGANMFNRGNSKGISLEVGATNVMAAKDVISETGMMIRSMDTGGYEKRKIFFDLSTGKVF